jgi:hypothetical protein
MSNVLLPTNGVTVIRGTSHVLELCVLDDKDQAVDLTGSRIVFTVKCSVQDASPLFQKDSVNPAEVEFTNPEGGIARINIFPADTQTRDTTEYVFDVWAVLASGKRFAVVGPSAFIIEPGVTLIP